MDRTIRRTIVDIQGQVFQLDFQATSTAVVEVCIGIGAWDSAADTEGQAVNTTMAPGTGPLSDAANSRWMIRCCIQIPVGLQVQFGSAENIVVNPTPGVYWILNGGTAVTGGFTFGCHVDTKVMRKLRGLETSWLNIALECSADPTPTAGDDITCQLDAISGRMLLQNAA